MTVHDFDDGFAIEVDSKVDGGMDEQGRLKFTVEIDLGSDGISAFMATLIMSKATPSLVRQAVEPFARQIGKQVGDCMADVVYAALSDFRASEGGQLAETLTDAFHKFVNDIERDRRKAGDN